MQTIVRIRNKLVRMRTMYAHSQSSMLKMADMAVILDLCSERFPHFFYLAAVLILSTNLQVNPPLGTKRIFKMAAVAASLDFRIKHVLINKFRRSSNYFFVSE